MKLFPKAFCFALLLGPAVSFAQQSSVTAQAMKLARDATAAADEKDYPAYLAKMQEAVALRPDFPRMLVNLAAAQVANDRLDDAVATLGRLAALGLHSPVEKSEEFAAVRDKKEFKAAVAKLAANLQPKGAGEIAFTLPDMTGLIEGIAWRAKTGDFFFGDVFDRTIWLRTPDKKIRRFSATGDDVFGIFGLVVDEEHGALWAATSAVPAMRGYTNELDSAAGLAEFDLDSGALRQLVRLPPTTDHQTHVLGDLAMASDGSVYLPDSGAPIVWVFKPGAKELEVFVENSELMSPQGAVVASDYNALYVADHANGLLRIDLASRRVARLDPPTDTTLVGLDGLIRAPNGDLIGIQNGVRPPRVVRIALDSSGEGVAGVTVLESARLNMPDPTLGCIAAGGNLFFIGNAGWSRFEGADIKPTPPRSVPVFLTKLLADPPAKKR